MGETRPSLATDKAPRPRASGHDPRCRQNAEKHSRSQGWVVHPIPHSYPAKFFRCASFFSEQMKIDYMVIALERGPNDALTKHPQTTMERWIAEGANIQVLNDFSPHVSSVYSAGPFGSLYFRTTESTLKQTLAVGRERSSPVPEARRVSKTLGVSSMEKNRRLKSRVHFRFLPTIPTYLGEHRCLRSGARQSRSARSPLKEEP